MQTKKLITANLIVYAIFFVINFFLLLLEKQVKESTSEVLYMIYVLIFLLVLVVANKNAYFNFEKKIKLFFIKGLIVALSFIVFYFIIYCFNWFVFYAFIK